MWCAASMPEGIYPNFLTSRKPAVSVKKVKGAEGEFTAIYWGSKTITAEEMREIAKYAGCHIFTDTGDVLYANRNYVTIHASETGVKTVRFPKKCTPTEVYDGRIFGYDVDEIEIDMETGETVMLRLN